MRVLIIEDDHKTSQYLKKGLTEAGFTVDCSEDGEEGLHLAQNGEFDLIILDVMLPKMDGWSILRELRRGGKRTLVIMLTARDQLGDRIMGLDSGADSYMVKPFAFSELLTIIRSLMRRGPQSASEIIKVADLEIDFFKHKATRNKTLLDLTPKEFALLALLARRKGEVISRTVISEQIWGLNFDSATNLVDVHIRRLRAKVDDPYDKKIIYTVRGIGYALRESE